ncbi:MAG: hypothetical protein WCK15_22650 [Pirellula sp.]
MEFTLDSYEVQCPKTEIGQSTAVQPVAVQPVAVQPVAVQPVYVPRTTTQNLIVYML